MTDACTQVIVCNDWLSEEQGEFKCKLVVASAMSVVYFSQKNGTLCMAVQEVSVP